MVSVIFDDTVKQYSLAVPGQYKKSGGNFSEFVSTPQNERLIAEMIQSHFVGDFCVVGEKVCCIGLHCMVNANNGLHTGNR